MNKYDGKWVDEATVEKIMTRNKKIIIAIIAVVTVVFLWFLSRGPENTKSVKLFYYNPKLDRDESGNIACSRNGLAPVERKIPITQTPIQDTIKLLLSGELTDEERAQNT